MTNEPQRNRILAIYRCLGITRMGTQGYLCLLAYLQTGPSTSAEIAAAFKLTEQTAREIVQRMGELGMAHTEGERRRADRGPGHPLWVAGPGPTPRRMPSRNTFPALMQLQNILRCMEDPARVLAIAEASGSNALTIGKVTKLGRRLGLCHIAAWEQASAISNGGQPVAAWVIGEGKDATRPKPMSPAEHNRKRQRADSAKAKAARILFALAGRREPEGCAA